MKMRLICPICIKVLAKQIGSPIPILRGAKWYLINIPHKKCAPSVKEFLRFLEVISKA